MKRLYTDFAHDPAWRILIETLPVNVPVVPTENGKHAPIPSNQMVWYRYDTPGVGYMDFSMNAYRFLPLLVELTAVYLRTKTGKNIDPKMITLFKSVGGVPHHVDGNPLKSSSINIGLYNSDVSVTTWLDEYGKEQETTVMPGEAYLLDSKSLHSVKPKPGHEHTERWMLSYISYLTYKDALAYWPNQD